MLAIKSLALIGIGGGVGSILRYLISLASLRFFQHNFPIGTFLANFIGCLLIGFFLGMYNSSGSFNEEHKLLFVVGFCGGFTTFSSFSLEMFRMIQNNQYASALYYVLASVLLGLLAVVIGFALSRIVVQ